jgi:hypothetical protein
MDDSAPRYRPLSRIAFRMVGEYIVSASARLIAAFDGDLAQGLLYVALLSKADLSPGAAAGTAPDRGEPIGVHALARSTRRPFETIRRQCGQLCHAGLAERSDHGIRVPATSLSRPCAQAIITGVHDSLVWMIEELARLGYPLPVPAQTPYDGTAATRGSCDLLLLAMEFGMPSHSDRAAWLTAVLFVAVMAANARGFTFDPELAIRYGEANTPPPDPLRRPLSASAAARGLGLPHATVRRHAEALVASGAFERVPGGYLASMAWMQRPDTLAHGQRMSQQMDRVVRNLVGAGFPFGDPASAYLAGGPMGIAFE